MFGIRKTIAIATIIGGGILLELCPQAIANPPQQAPIQLAQATSTEDLDYLKRLNSIPVFGILDDSGNPILASGNYDGQTRQVAFVWLDPQEAQSVLEEVRQEDPDLVANAQVAPLALGEVLSFSESADMPDDWLLQVIPRQEDVAAAKELWALEDSGKTGEFNGIPMFYGTTNEELLLVESEGESLLPVFSSKDELQGALIEIAEQDPEIPRQVRIEVTTLEDVLTWMTDPEIKPYISQIVFIPTWEAEQQAESMSNPSPSES